MYSEVKEMERNMKEILDEVEKTAPKTAEEMRVLSESYENQNFNEKFSDLLNDIRRYANIGCTAITLNVLYDNAFNGTNSQKSIDKLRQMGYIVTVSPVTRTRYYFFKPNEEILEYENIKIQWGRNEGK